MEKKINLIKIHKVENSLANISSFFNEICEEQLEQLKGGMAAVHCRRGYATATYPNGEVEIQCRCGYGIW